MSEPTYLDVAERWARAHSDVLRRAGEHWVEHGAWMTVPELGLEILRREDRDVMEDLRALPPPLGRIEWPEERIELRVRALTYVPRARDLLDDFVRVVELIAHRLLDEQSEPLLLRSTDLPERLGIPPERATLVSQLVFREDWMLGGGSGDADGQWVRVIGERAIPVRNVTNLDDYLHVEGERFWNLPASRDTTPAPVLIEAEPPMAVLLAVDELHPGVAGAAGTLLADGHFDAAVHAAALALRDLLREHSGRDELDGAQLVDAALGGSSPAVLVADITKQPGRREQEGWRMLAAGCVAALRNPVAHRHVFSDYASAFEAVATMSLVARRLDATASPN